jgi:hypothetical protein
MKVNLVYIALEWDLSNRSKLVGSEAGKKLFK